MNHKKELNNYNAGTFGSQQRYAESREKFSVAGIIKLEKGIGSLRNFFCLLSAEK
jgi:hypothetical protein